MLANRFIAIATLIASSACIAQGQAVPRVDDTVQPALSSPYVVQGDRFLYDVNGHVIEREHFGSDTSTPKWDEHYQYDADGQMVGKTRHDGTQFVYKYTADGQLLTLNWSETGQDQKIVHDYDVQSGLLSSLSEGGETLTYSYYPDGSERSLQYPDNKIQSEQVDQYGRIVGLDNVADKVEAFSYNDKNQLSHITYRNDSVDNVYATSSAPINHHFGQLQSLTLTGPTSGQEKVSFDYNGLDKVSETAMASGSVSFANTYDYDAFDRLTTTVKSSTSDHAADLNLTEQYQYDSLNQLTASKSRPSDKEEDADINTSYHYDGNGNVIGIDKNRVSSPVIYNALDQRIMDQSYDKNGRVTQDKAGNRYVYNELDQLVKRTGADGLVVNYDYYPDALLAHRIIKDNKGITKSNEQFYYASGKVSAIQSKANNDTPVWTDFLLVGGKRLAAYSSDDSVSPTYYLLSNKSTGASLQDGKLQGYHYGPYGKDAPFPKRKEGVPAPQPINRQSDKSFTWDQEYRDPATKLTYLRARFYNPDSQSFMSMDDALVDNKYNFGNGDPLNNVDPSGHFATLIAIAITSFIVSAGAGAAASAVHDPGAKSALMGISIASGVVAIATTGGMAISQGLADAKEATALGETVVDTAGKMSQGRAIGWALVGSIAVGSALSLATNPNMRSPQGLLILGLANIGAIFGGLGFVSVQWLPLYGAIDNMLEGAAIGIVNGKDSHNEFMSIFAGLVSGAASGYIGGLFVQKYMGSVYSEVGGLEGLTGTELRDAKAEAWARAAALGRNKSLVYFGVRGATMEAIRSILYAGVGASGILSWKGYWENTIVNLGIGAIGTVLEGPTMVYMNNNGYKGYHLRGQMGFNMAAGVLFQNGIPLMESLFHQKQ